MKEGVSGEQTPRSCYLQQQKCPDGVRWTLNHSQERKWSGCQPAGAGVAGLASGRHSDCVIGVGMRAINLDYFLSQPI